MQQSLKILFKRGAAREGAKIPILTSKYGNSLFVCSETESVDEQEYFYDCLPHYFHGDDGNNVNFNSYPYILFPVEDRTKLYQDWFNFGKSKSLLLPKLQQTFTQLIKIEN